MGSSVPNSDLVVPLRIIPEFFKNVLNLAALFNIILELLVDLLHRGQTPLLNPQIVPDERAHVIGVRLLVVAGVLFNGAPVVIIELLLLLHGPAHENEVPDLVALIQIKTSRIEALKHQLRVVIWRRQRDVDDLELLHRRE